MSSIIDGVDYGPLAALAGRWKGDTGMDVAPEPDGEEHNPYYESIVFEPGGDVTNAEEQTLAVMRYHQVVSRKSNDEVFHNETGYWMWDAVAGVVMQSLTIPRGVCLLAGGSAGAGAGTLRVHSAIDDRDWCIVQSPFMRDKAQTVEFTHEITVAEDTLTYSETTMVDIYGRRFEHTDTNSLGRAN